MGLCSFQHSQNRLASGSPFGGATGASATERAYLPKRFPHLTGEVQRPQRTDGAGAAQLHRAGYSGFDGRGRLRRAAPHPDVLRQREPVLIVLNEQSFSKP